LGAGVVRHLGIVAQGIGLGGMGLSKNSVTAICQSGV
jgi:hypothetical protein